MGTDLSCFNTNRLVTLPDSNLERSLTDDEKTEFLANKNSIFLEGLLKNPMKDPDYITNCTNLLNKIVYSVKTEPELKKDYIRPLSGCTMNSFSPDKITQSSPCLKKNRIYSSNISDKSVNIINTLNKSTSACSTNLNSKSNSRCVSPLIKARLSLID